MRFVLALLVVTLVAGGLVVLALQYSGGRATSDVGLTPTRTLADITHTPERVGGLGGSPVPAGTPLPTGTPHATVVAQVTASRTAISSSTTPSAADQALQTLDAEQVPVRDPYSITARLRQTGNQPLPRTVEQPAGTYQVGHVDTFYMSDILAKRYYTATATLLQLTEHAYWYVQDGQQVDTEALERAGRNFEEKIYPANHRLFGTEWVPGVDSDPRLTVLIAHIPGAGGYFTSADEYTRSVNPFSNQRELIYVSMSGGWEGVESTLAHELQHMIHWNQNPGHDVWLNEGASMLAQEINGYGTGGVEHGFMTEPDLQLNAWQANPDAARGNYGASFLFFEFLRSHYGGDDMLRELVAAPGRGIDSVDYALDSLGSTDRFLDVFERWTLANLLDGAPGAEEAGLYYPDRDVQVSPQEAVDSYPKSLAGTVSQFGTDYIELTPPADGATLQIDFSGRTEGRVIPTSAHSGDGIWWSNRGDQADSTLTRRFDLTAVESATLEFYAWFEIEGDLDYAYVEASTDNGQTWTTLEGEHTTGANPNGNNLGYGYTGNSADSNEADANGWLHEKIGLSKYAGREIMLRFEYITDDGFNTTGFAVDDIAVPEIGYRDDAETDSGWEGEGFVRIANKLPQTYHMAVVKFKDDGFDIQPVQVGEDGKATFEIEGLGAGGEYSRAVLLVSGTTRHSILPTEYELNISVVR